MTATPLQLDENEVDACLSACRYLSNFIDKGDWRPEHPLEQLLVGTLARGRGTFETIIDLVEQDRTLQAAMLGRPLFEDMAVAHWIALHAEDPGWLLAGFARHADAMRLQEASIAASVDWINPPEISDLQGREDELRREFGRHAERDWWSVSREGTRMTMPTLVELLANESRFQPRLKGDSPILQQYYAIQHKDWTQSLHHTAAGMYPDEAEPGRVPTARPGPDPFTILFGNYWVFGQLVFVALATGAEPTVSDRFEDQFLAGLAVLGAVAGVPTPHDWT